MSEPGQGRPDDDGTYEPYVPARRPAPDQPVPRPEGAVERSGDGRDGAHGDRTPAPYRRGLSGLPLQPFVVASTICTVIWLMTDPGGYFWPMWVMLGTGIPVLVALAARLR